MADDNGFMAALRRSAKECECCDAAADEIERLRAEMQQVRLDHITTLAELQEAADEIEGLRAAGDVLAHLILPHAHLSVPCRPLRGTPLDEWCSECAALAAWQEACRG